MARGFLLLPGALLVAQGCSLVLGDGGLSGGGAPLDGGLEGGFSRPPPSLVDCRDPNHSGDFACRTIETLEPGSVGQGPAPIWVQNSIRKLQVVGGAIHAGELFLAVRSSENLGQGGVLGVDLATGARRLVSGTLLTTEGSLTQGTGDNFAELAGVGFGGGLFAHIWPEWGGFTGFIYDIDAHSGDHTTRTIGDKCESALPQPLSKEGWIFPAVAPDTTVYLAAVNLQGEHIVRVLGDECDLFATLTLPGSLQSMRWQNGQLWLVDNAGSTLQSMDLSTGKTTAVSQTTPAVPGLEPITLGNQSVAVDGNTAWTVGSAFEGGFHLVEVNVATGERKLHAEDVGPARTSAYFPKHVFVHPTLAAVIVVMDGAVILYDPATDESNVLSY